jgi:DNA ligase-1
MTATQWDVAMDANGWWLTEKFDGMRLFWDGTDFFTRQGNKIPVPDSLKIQLPKIALDGELW